MNNNTGTENTGYNNSGHCNSGHCNSGNRNSGDWNSGYSNSGDCNSGNRNSGDWNSGYSNSGDWNSGDWNSGDRNSGHFNSNTPDKIRVFNKDCDRETWDSCNKPDFTTEVLITNWIPESEMTEAEKTENKDFNVREGYLKTIDYKEAWKIAYDNSTKEDKELLIKLPNFDAKVFEEITGINVSEKSHTVEIAGKTIHLSESSFNELKATLVG